jgi:hypothetical protein
VVLVLALVQAVPALRDLVVLVLVVLVLAVLALAVLALAVLALAVRVLAVRVLVLRVLRAAADLEWRLEAARTGSS